MNVNFGFKKVGRINISDKEMLCIYVYGKGRLKS